MCMCRGIRPRRYEGFVGVVQPHLRPLGAGEVLDRAVTLFVRQFFPLVLTLAVAVIPVAIVSYVSHPTAAANAWQNLISPAPVQPGHETEVLKRALTQFVTPAAALGLLVTMIVITIANTACAIVAVAAYRGASVSIVEAF